MDLTSAGCKRESMAKQERYVVPEDRAIGHPYMMGWLDLLGEDKELICGGNKGKEEKG